MPDSVATNLSSKPATGRRRVFDCALILLFVPALCLPMLGRLTGWAPPFDAGFERRESAALPKIEYRQRGFLQVPRRGSLFAFPGLFEAYFNDQLGFRADLVQLYTQACAAGYVPPALANSSGGGTTRGPVLVGRDGWLYVNGDCVENYRNTRPFTEAELDAWVDALQKRRNWLAQRNIQYLFFIAPDKATIYPEHLPRSVNQVRPKSRLDQLLERLQATTNVPTLDLRPALLAAKAQNQIYYRIDSHWNARGGWVGYREVCRVLQTMLPQFQAQSFDDYQFVQLGTRVGDLATQLPSPAWRETGYVGFQAKKSSHVVIQEEPIAVGDGKYVPGHRFVNPTAAHDRVFALHDSFFGGMIQYLSEHWQQGTYVPNYVDFPAELIEREQPEIVIDQLVERRLMIPPPVNPPRLNQPAAAMQWTQQPSSRLLR